MLKAKEIRALSAEELNQRAGELRATLFNLRIKHRSGTLDSTADLAKSRRDLARVLTVIREKGQ